MEVEIEQNDKAQIAKTKKTVLLTVAIVIVSAPAPKLNKNIKDIVHTIITKYFFFSIFNYSPSQYS